MVLTFFDKKTGSGDCVKEELAKELHKPLIKKFVRRKVYARFKDNMWTEDLVEMGSLSSKNRGFKNLSQAIDVFTKYFWAKPLKGKKTKIVLHGFIEIVNESKRKPNNLWISQGKEFYNSLTQKWLDYNDILIYLTHKLVVAQRFIRT